MDSVYTYDDFVLHMQKLRCSDIHSKEEATKWLENFDKSKRATIICKEILKNSLEDDLKLHAVKIKFTSEGDDHNKLMETYKLLFDWLKKSPSLEAITQVG
ncbi:hypothetical protein RF11_03849 [Thelohanellus kitauei]|uniref:Uncharacterized protein n=1 Tax=Thelohanellus kitauei TaxID=669202 RepID=A0A0C2MF84_THEKT|nr:hypothetical protein RF11_03849 [Thelohanellus kitauei]